MGCLAQSRTDGLAECEGAQGKALSQGCLAGQDRWLDFDRNLNWGSSRKKVTLGPWNIYNSGVGEGHWRD